MRQAPASLTRSLTHNPTFSSLADSRPQEDKALPPSLLGRGTAPDACFLAEQRRAGLAVTLPNVTRTAEAPSARQQRPQGCLPAAESVRSWRAPALLQSRETGVAFNVALSRRLGRHRTAANRGTRCACRIWFGPTEENPASDAKYRFARGGQSTTALLLSD